MYIPISIDTLRVRKYNELFLPSECCNTLSAAKEYIIKIIIRKKIVKERNCVRFFSISIKKENFAKVEILY